MMKPPPKKGMTATQKAVAAITNPARRIQKKSQPTEEHEEHGGEEIWLVSYADMMTLLFGFFVILFSMSTLDTNKYEKMRKAAAESFGGEYQLPTEAIKREVEVEMKNAGIDSGDVKINQTIEGLELDFKGAAFFNSGSSELSTAAKDFVTKTVAALKGAGNNYSIRIEGHTDDAPMKSAMFPSNWELSSARADAVVRMMEAQGIPVSQLEAIGFGSSRPAKPNRDADGHPILANMAENRRILIHMKKLSTADVKRLNGGPAGGDKRDPASKAGEAKPGETKPAEGAANSAPAAEAAPTAGSVAGTAPTAGSVSGTTAAPAPSAPATSLAK